MRHAIQCNPIAPRLPLFVCEKHVLEIINMKCIQETRTQTGETDCFPPACCYKAGHTMQIKSYIRDRLENIFSLIKTEDKLDEVIGQFLLDNGGSSGS